MFERLVSGQESETRETPPSYDFLNDGTSGHGQSSISVAVREVPLNVAPRRQMSGILGYTSNMANSLVCQYFHLIAAFLIEPAVC